MTQTFTGVIASPGLAIGRARLYTPPTTDVSKNTVEDTAAEVARFEAAVGDAVREVAQISETAREDPVMAEEVKILEAHQMILRDPEFVSVISTQIRDASVNAEFALQQRKDELVAMFESMDNDYMRQRSADIRDISGRVMAKLQGVAYGFDVDDATDVVLVANDLHPSDTIQLDLTRVHGFVTDVGGTTSHTAIMARTRGIPAVVGTQNFSEQVEEGALLIVDGNEGRVYVNPTPEQVSMFRQKLLDLQEKQTELMKLVHAKSKTRDGHSIELAANIGVPEDAVFALQNGAEGVGLFRSEFLFMNRLSVPSEDEQFAAYKAAATTLDGKPVIIRTVDIGGDKPLDYLDVPKEMNPFLGFRAIRISLKEQELFKTQLRAILRASHYGTVRVMYPMIATLDEVREAKALLESAKADLRLAGIPFDEAIQQGIMIEIPAAAVAADTIAPEVDFFSIGTNDLIQYTLACDRMNEQVSYLYQPYHPAILRLVKLVVEAAHHCGKWVGMCGEMAGDTLVVPALVGLGLDELSMSPAALLPVRQIIRNCTQKELVQLAETILKLSTSSEVQATLESFVQ